MGRSRKRLQEIADSFMSEMETLFPGVEQRPTLEDVEGYEVWVHIQVPEQLISQFWQIQDAAGVLFERLTEETGVNVIASVSTKKPELVPMRGER